MKFSIALLLLLQVAFSYQSQVTVSVFYETLCKDSVNFITEQLVPTWKQFGGAGNKVFVIDYVPYGKATEDKETNKTMCHHEEAECEKNKEHACALKVLPKPEITPFINCSLLEIAEKCTTLVNLEKIKTCVKDDGQSLLFSYGERTRKLTPPLTEVPWILFDTVYTKEDQQKALINLKDVLCQKSKLCATSASNYLEPIKFLPGLVISFAFLNMHFFN